MELERSSAWGPVLPARCGHSAGNGRQARNRVRYRRPAGSFDGGAAIAQAESAGVAARNEQISGSSPLVDSLFSCYLQVKHGGKEAGQDLSQPNLLQPVLQPAALSRIYSEVVRGLSTKCHLLLTPSFCIGCHKIFLFHCARMPAIRRRAFTFPSRNSASTAPSARFAVLAPVTVLTVQATPSRATCFLLRSMRTPSAR